jgi:hypothetical protein
MMIIIRAGDNQPVKWLPTRWVTGFDSQKGQGFFSSPPLYPNYPEAELAFCNTDTSEPSPGVK